MKNLFERLKPEYLQKLNEAEDLYPNLIKNVFFDLKQNNFWCDLTYYQIIIFLDHLDIYDLSPNTIEKLFDND